MPTTVLTNLERRAVGNLSIPRNVTDLAHMLRQDPHAPTRDESALHNDLLALEGDGLVVNLGEHEDLAKLAAGLERHKTAHEMPDEKAAIYVERLKHGSRTWRRTGDLWMLTDEGFAQLTAPHPDHDVYATSTADLERIISAEFQRVLHEVELVGSIHDPDGGTLRKEIPLANALLVEEYTHWLELVVAEHERQTGERPRLPIGGAAGYGDATELLILAADTGGTAYGETSPTFTALVTVAVTDADTGSTITRAAYTGYADKSTANTDFNSPASGAHTNANAITFAACTASSSTVIGFCRVTSSGGGRLIRMATCTSTVVSTTNTPASFAAAAYSDTLD
jgi:hypothetical protein